MEEDIKRLEELLKKATPFSMKPSTYNAIENVINRLKEDEAVIKEMAKEINDTDQGYYDYCNSTKECTGQECVNCIEQYFRKKVKDE